MPLDLEALEKAWQACMDAAAAGDLVAFQLCHMKLDGALKRISWQAWQSKPEAPKPVARPRKLHGPRRRTGQAYAPRSY